MKQSRPREFLWGAATAAYQIEGAATADGKGPSIWDVFAQIPGRIRSGDSGAVACDHYHLWKQDVALMKQIGLKAYRLSLSWPRVQPAGRGAWNEAGWRFYSDLIDELLSAGIQPMVTLYHWDLPAALQMELGGWVHDDLPRIFAEYAAEAYQRLGDRVKLWITLNEPWCSAKGYIDGGHAPGMRDVRLGYRAAHNLLRAHAYAVAGFRQACPRGQISFAVNTSYGIPASDKPADHEAAERAMLNFAGWFADPPHFGDYPAVLRKRLGDLLPAFSDEDTRLLRRSMDYIGLNYYFSEVVRHAPGNGAMELEFVPQTGMPHTEMGWAINPDGLRLLLHWLAKRYQGLPLYITENGMAAKDVPDADGFVQDDARIAYLHDHIAALQRAANEGLDIRGYYAWSLLDNLEWAEGFSKRFGIIRCDFETQRRTIKASGQWYARLIASGQLPPVEAAVPQETPQ